MSPPQPRVQGIKPGGSGFGVRGLGTETGTIVWCCPLVIPAFRCLFWPARRICLGEYVSRHLSVGAFVVAAAAPRYYVIMAIIVTRLWRHLWHFWPDDSLACLHVCIHIYPRVYAPTSIPDSRR